MMHNRPITVLVSLGTHSQRKINLMITKVGSHTLQNKNAVQWDAYHPLHCPSVLEVSAFGCRGGVCLWVQGVSASGYRRVVCLWVGAVSTTPPFTTAPPWTEWLADRCKNITLLQTSFAGGKYNHRIDVFIQYSLTVKRIKWCESV